MLCEKCGKNKATTHIHSIVKGVLMASHVCSSCAAKAGYGDVSEDNLEQMLSYVFGDSISEKKKKSTMSCPCCGMTFAEISQSGKCGCSECYTLFFDQLLPYFKRVHGSVQHIGKKPEKVINQINSAHKIDELRTLLKKLIEEENYEQAAIVRDKIKSLQEGVLQ